MIFKDKQADGELTGYPSIDKPWLSYYSKEAAQAEVPDMNLYEYMYQQNSQNQNNTALDYFGKKISYAELFDNIDKVMHSFISLGVKKGDIVTFFALNTPECIYIIYALNRLGVMVNLEYLNLTEKNMQENIRNAKSEYVVTVDVCQDIVLQAVKEIDTVREVLIVPIFQSLSGLKKAVMSLKSIGKTRQRGMKYTDFIKRAKRLQGTPEKGLGKESALIIHSGGTTGVPKGVMLTNGGVNAVAVEYQYSLLDLKKGDSILNIAPPFVAFGACLAIHAPLCRGLRVCLCPSPAPELSAKTYQRYRPTHYLGGPANLKDIVSKLEGKKLDLSHISTVACGGEQIHKEDADEYVEFFRKKGAHITHLIPGYGMTEFGGTVVTSGDHAYKDGSVGIPFALANIKIVDLENGMELGFDKEGEIWMTSPSLMKGYFGGIEKDAIVEDENGVRWMKTGDLGKVDRDGFVYLVGRIKRIYLVKGTDDGSVYKLFPDYIENVLRSDDTVDKAAVIVEKRGDANYVPIAYIETKSGQKPDVDRLMDFCKEKLPLYMVPVQIIHTDKIPVTVSGKIDYRKLEEMNQGEI